MSFLYSKLSILIILIILISNSSCLKRKFVYGKSELISVSDTLLNDSSVFVGYIFPINSTTKYPAGHCEVWINSTLNMETNDSAGYYQLKTLPGTYSISCQAKGNEWGELIEETENVKIEKNKKIRIDFYLGYTIE